MVAVQTQFGHYYFKMENRTKLEAGVFVLMTLLMSGAYFVAQGDKAYYCETSNLVGICDKLSTGLGTRCYYGDTYKICSTGWKLIEKEVIIQPTLVGKQYLCSPEGCVVKE